MATAIKIENLSKQYRLGLVSTRTISHDLSRWWHMNILQKEDPFLKIGDTNVRETKGKSEYVWALKDINLEVDQGEVLGIIGNNGAGKSTLLKILSKVTGPTTGIIKARGRIASLLEVGTGFHAEMTGRENIYLNGAILGMTKAEIRRKEDEMIDFAGVERYIDTPVKRYSSGMMVRLGFAVAAHLEPDILIVDEVLAVGDAEFQKKAIGKMQDASKTEGRTVLFVSHNMNAVKLLCKKGIILSDGQIIKTDNNIADLIRTYLNRSTLQSKYQNNWTNRGNDYDNEYLRPVKLLFTDFHGDRSQGVLFSGEDIFINIEIDIKKLDRALILGYVIYNEDDQILYWTYFNDTANIELNVGRNLLVSKIPPNVLNEGLYRLEICGGIHNQKWLFEPGKDNPYIMLNVEGGERKSAYWTNRRPTLIAPSIEWNIKQIK